jgi:large subunit ribosomal protein L17
MRHNRKHNHLGRTHSHRHALLSNLAASLILHKRINTTLAKAKALRIYVEPIITRSKNDTTHSRRMVFRYLQNKTAVSELFREVAPKVNERPGGYTRIIKMGNRPGDNAEMCMMELVDFNTLLTGAKEGAAAAKKTTRRGGATRKKAAAPKSEKEAPAAAEEAPKKKAVKKTTKKKEDKGE